MPDRNPTEQTVTVESSNPRTLTFEVFGPTLATGRYTSTDRSPAGDFREVTSKQTAPSTLTALLNKLSLLTGVESFEIDGNIIRLQRRSNQPAYRVSWKVFGLIRRHFSWHYASLVHAARRAA